jgi:hypothetical protein
MKTIETDTQDCPGHRINTVPGQPLRSDPRGESALVEARRLLDGMRIGTKHGTYINGKEVAIYVGPETDETDGRTRIVVTCHAYGNRIVGWRGLPIFVVEADKDKTADICTLNKRGHAWIYPLVPGAYRLVTSEVFGRGKDAPVPRKADGLEGRTIPTKVFAGDKLSPESWFAESNDGRVCATVRPKGGQTVVAFETKDACLAGALVRFAIVTQSGHTKHAGEVRLEAHDTEKGIWEGRWLGTLAVDEPCELVFDVHPVT